MGVLVSLGVFRSTAGGTSEKLDKRKATRVSEWLKRKSDNKEKGENVRKKVCPETDENVISFRKNMF